MSQTTVELNIVAEIEVNNEGSAEGWVPTLPGGQADNALFTVVSDPVPVVSGITRVSTTATVVTTDAHHLVTGMLITISSADQADYNGTFAITVVDETSFTYQVANSPVTPATGAIAAVASGDFLRIAAGAGYLRPRKYTVEVRWDKVGEPASIEQHIMDIGDYGVSNLSDTTNRLEIPASTIPAIGASDDFELRLEVWIPTAEPAGVRNIVGVDANNKLNLINSADRIQFYDNSVLTEAAATFITNSWNQIRITREDDAGYKTKVYLNGTEIISIATNISWNVALAWKIFDDANVASFVASNLYVIHTSVLRVYEELRDDAGVLTEVGTPTYQTQKGNA